MDQNTNLTKKLNAIRRFWAIKKEEIDLSGFSSSTFY